MGPPRGDVLLASTPAKRNARGILALLDSDETNPVNIGNPIEMTMNDFAATVKEVTNSSSPIVYQALPEDDPKVRQPDITRARELLGWEPRISVKEGLARTAEDIAGRLDSGA